MIYLMIFSVYEHLKPLQDPKRLCEPPFKIWVENGNPCFCQMSHNEEYTWPQCDSKINIECFPWPRSHTLMSKLSNTDQIWI